MFSLEELVEAFDLNRVSKSGAKFSPDKTNWFNQQYLQQKSNKELTELYTVILSEKGINTNLDFTEKVVSLIKERATFVTDFWELSSFFFENPIEYDVKATKKQWKETTGELMQELITIISKIEDFTVENTQTEIKGWITSKEIGFGKVMQPLRLSLVGKLAGPDLFDIMTMIGKKNTLLRIKNAIDKLS